MHILVVVGDRFEGSEYYHMVSRREETVREAARRIEGELGSRAEGEKFVSGTIGSNGRSYYSLQAGDTFEVYVAEDLETALAASTRAKPIRVTSLDDAIGEGWDDEDSDD